jgi:DNA-binding CsgD family transcriptional regulator
MMNKRRYNLTDRELEVARWILLGFTTKQISRSLSISPRTVDQHIVNIKMKLGVNNRSNMAAHLIVKNLVQLTVEDLEEFG